MHAMSSPPPIALDSGGDSLNAGRVTSMSGAERGVLFKSSPSCLGPAPASNATQNISHRFVIPTVVQHEGNPGSDSHRAVKLHEAPLSIGPSFQAVTLPMPEPAALPIDKGVHVEEELEILDNLDAYSDGTFNPHEAIARGRPSHDSSVGLASPALKVSSYTHATHGTRYKAQRARHDIYRDPVFDTQQSVCHAWQSQTRINDWISNGAETLVETDQHAIMHVDDRDYAAAYAVGLHVPMLC